MLITFLADTQELCKKMYSYYKSFVAELGQGVEIELEYRNELQSVQQPKIDQRSSKPQIYFEMG